MKLSFEDLIRNSCVVHTNDMSTPSELRSLHKCLYSTDVADFQYSGVRYMFLPSDVCYVSETPQVKLIQFLNVMMIHGPYLTTI